MGRRAWLAALALPLACTVANPNYQPGDGGGGAGLEPGQQPGGDLSSSGHDSAWSDDLAAAAPDLRAVLGCGDPGDPGNGLGVGKYCDNSSECAGQPADFCATVFDPNAHFCTGTCQPGSSCGDGASCRCDPRGCACVPDSCQPAPVDMAHAPPDLASNGQCLGANQSCLGVLSGCCSGLACNGLLGRCCAPAGWACDDAHPCCAGNCATNGTCH